MQENILYLDDNNPKIGTKFGVIKIIGIPFYCRLTTSRCHIYVVCECDCGIIDVFVLMKIKQSPPQICKHLNIRKKYKHKGYHQCKFDIQQRKRDGKYIECETCKSIFYVHPERLKRRSNVRFCSMKCYNKQGNNNPFWGKTHSKETKIKFAKNPNRHKFKLGHFNEHIFGKDFRGKTFIWWRKFLIKTLGKCELCSWNIEPKILELHHIDRNRNNNCRENVLLLCPNCHELEHFKAKDGKYASGNIKQNQLRKKNKDSMRMS